MCACVGQRCTATGIGAAVASPLHLGRGWAHKGHVRINTPHPAPASQSFGGGGPPGCPPLPSRNGPCATVMSGHKERRWGAVQMCKARQKAPVSSPKRSAVARPRLWRHSMTPRENIYSRGPRDYKRTAPEMWTPADCSRPSTRKCGGGYGAVQLNLALPTSW